jgi:hypothetical protein
MSAPRPPTWVDSLTPAAALAEQEVAGYERTVVLAACGRCILLAERLYRYSTGFLRHPRCDCQMKPVTWSSGAKTGPATTRVRCSTG